METVDPFGNTVDGSQTNKGEIMDSEIA